MAYCQSYAIGDTTEYCLSVGAATATRRILIIPPLFDEMNRMRRVLVSAMRLLAAQDIASVMPDLPGCNESQSLLSDQNLSTWRNALSKAAIAAAATHIASIRGGALIDDICVGAPHWRLSPAKGETLLRAMLRTRVAGDKESGLSTTSEALIARAQTENIELAGNILGPQLVADLAITLPAQIKDVQLRTLGDGPDMIAGKALWLRAEPQDDAEFAAAIAADIALWSDSCAA